MSTNGGPRRAGFTLVELLVVIAIIGIIISFILVAARDGVRRAEEKATQSLITKLDFAVADRIDALFNTQAPINQTHRFLAAINAPASTNYVPLPGSVEARAQVIAQNDFLRYEFPEVFFRNSETSNGSTLAGQYPLNFGASPYPLTSNAIDSYVLPLGNTVLGLPYTQLDVANGIFVGTGEYLPRTGIFGASFAAAGGLYKNLGYQKQGYDGVDNGGNGYVDELGAESGTTFDAVDEKLKKHTHKTARAEVLYASLVEGLGPLGSAFTPDDFTDKEVRDTDGDGLPEFVDAWGEPLQFFRWPIYYGAVPGSSDTQRGWAPYGGPAEVREQDNYDPNQQLTAPGWWNKTANPSLPTITGFSPTFAPPNGTDSSGKMSPGAIAFTSYFRSLVDPQATSTGGTMWDRSNAMNRRAYFSKFLILSSGPDKEPGVGQFNKDYTSLVDDPTGVSFQAFPDSTKSIAVNARYLTLIENQAAQEDPNPAARVNSFWETVPNSGSNVSAYLQGVAGVDDITNHNISAPGTGVR
ncbi:prepilin-type N-terminal cleavage/methylation domain-containing protein [Tundrisphaera sp. TA3]|uniref:prepilin-type N-terminal cleavage/methylation domain-containing protein n=1 Tax=Tundrisphaera sp. TA3 TaxID=3435775 RepID=UPI003EBC6CD5